MTCGVEHEDAAGLGADATHGRRSEPGDLPYVVTWRRAVLAHPVACPRCGSTSCIGAMPPTRRWTLTALSLYATRDGDRCYPSQDTLARDTGLARRVVGAHLRAAEAAGWIERSGRGVGGRGWRRHAYVLTVPAAPTCGATPADVGTQSTRPTGRAMDVGTESTRPIDVGTQGAQPDARRGYSGDIDVGTESATIGSTERMFVEEKISPTRGGGQAHAREGDPQTPGPDRAPDSRPDGDGTLPLPLDSTPPTDADGTDATPAPTPDTADTDSPWEDEWPSE